MDFVSAGYYYWFLPLTILLFFILFRGRRDYRIIMLVAMSYAFFWMASGWHLCLLIISTLTDWIAGKKINATRSTRQKKTWLYVSLIVNLGILTVFKYLDFIIQSINLITLRLPGAIDVETLGMALPIGISFYTFQTMSYTIDIYRGKAKPYHKFFDFTCYASFFPQLVAGPIVRSDEFKIELDKSKVFSLTGTRLGITLIIYGLFKKMVIADNLALHVDSIFIEGNPLENTALIWWGSLCFGLQIYCDFSGYTDVALGSAHLLGIRLPENFKTPYAATSPRDFWRRWHISLSTWLRDYVYITLGGNRNGQTRMYAALMVTMLLGGLWHGASWNFVLWGFLHGLLLIMNRVLSESHRIYSMFLKFPRVMTTFSWASTQYFIFLTWLVFRIEDTSILWRSTKAFVGIDSHFDIGGALSTMPYTKVTTFLMVALFVCGHLASGKVGGGKYWISRQNPIFWGLVMGLMLISITLLRPVETVDFIYFRF